VEEESDVAPVAPAGKPPVAGGGYWSGRLGARGSAGRVWPPPPPSPASAPNGDPVEAVPRPASRRAGRTPRAVVMYGPYRAHDPTKNWIIGGVAVVVLIAATVVMALTSAAGVRHSLASLTALPSSGSRTVAWYWPGGLVITQGAQPLNVTDDFGFSTIATSVQEGGLAYFVGLDRHGDAWVWGRDAGPRASLPVSGQPTAVTMPAGVHFTDLSTNDGYIVALDQTGRIWSWGDAAPFLLTTTTAPPNTQKPMEVPTPSGVTFTTISVGSDYALALDSSGHVWAWGTNDEGNLGVATMATALATPTRAATPPGVVFTAVSADTTQSVALDSSGRAWTWGDGANGDLGVSAASVPRGAGSCPATTGAFCSYSPLLVSLPPGVKLTAVAAGSGYDAALDATGRIWTWGTSIDGALGLGATASTCSTLSCIEQPGQRQVAADSTPARVAAPHGVRFVAVALTQGGPYEVGDTVALDSAGDAWAWGTNGYLRLTSGVSACSSTAGQPEPDEPGAQQCVLKPTALPMPSGVTFKGVSSTQAAVFGFPH
jgi:alpha-tubulin suppressor-like RCC1 family protein